jgi:hypothetical protein
MLEELTMPVTLLRGMAAGSVVDDDDEARVRRRSPQATVVHVEGAGHSVQGDQPLELAALLERSRCLSLANWLAGEGSNLQPTDSKSGVLPIELPATADTGNNLQRFLANDWRRLIPTATLEPVLPSRKPP